MCGILGYVSHGSQQDAASVIIRGLQAARCPRCALGSRFAFVCFDANHRLAVSRDGIGRPDDDAVAQLPHTIAGLGVIVADTADVPHTIREATRDGEQLWVAIASPSTVATIFGEPTRFRAVDHAADFLLPWDSQHQGSFQRERAAQIRLSGPAAAIVFSTLHPFQLTVVAKDLPLHIAPNRGEAMVASSMDSLRSVTNRFTSIGEDGACSGTLCGCGLHLINHAGEPIPFQVHSIEALDMLMGRLHRPNG